MATFTYIAKKADGSETRGTIDAVSPDAAREELRKRGLMIEDLSERRTAPPAPVVAQQPKPTAPSVPVAAKPAAAPPTANKPAPLPWSGSTNTGPARKQTTKEEGAVEYAPLHETLRIFAGWLLAWYGLIYALGFLEYAGKLPQIPFVHELFVSPLVLQFTFGTFLLLALSNLHRWIGRGTLAGFVLAIAYVGLVAGFVVYG